MSLSYYNGRHKISLRENCQKTDVATVEVTTAHSIYIYLDSKLLVPVVNFSRMSPKLVQTYPHTVENRGIAMAPLILRLIS